MSLPPQLIRVKRKRGDEETRVTFLHFDDGNVKRHRAGSDWAYQRRDAFNTTTAVKVSRDAAPVIHVSQPEKDISSESQSLLAGDSVAHSVARARSPASLKRMGVSTGAAQRKFHISKATMNASKLARNAGLERRARHNAAIFVERNGRSQKAKQSATGVTPVQQGDNQTLLPIPDRSPSLPEPKQLKKPTSKSKLRSLQDESSAPTRSPMPSVTREDQDMVKIAADMNSWVLSELSANLEAMEQEKQREANKARFRPKAPAQRYGTRHPDLRSLTNMDDAQTAMDSATEDEEDGDEWIIEEYIRIPANTVALSANPEDVGWLVLDGDEESILFYGPENDEEEEGNEDDEDENAEDYYTADYPEDEVESDDEYGRRPYGYRNGGASDNEEFDKDYSSEDDEMVIDGDSDDDDDDGTAARIRAHLRRGNAFR